MTRGGWYHASNCKPVTEAAPALRPEARILLLNGARDSGEGNFNNICAFLRTWRERESQRFVVKGSGPLPTKSVCMRIRISPFAFEMQDGTTCGQEGSLMIKFPWRS